MTLLAFLLLEARGLLAHPNRLYLTVTRMLGQTDEGRQLMAIKGKGSQRYYGSIAFQLHIITNFTQSITLTCVAFSWELQFTTLLVDTSYYRQTLEGRGHSGISKFFCDSKHVF